jgi:ring-1,2-phenylacetyl-CoA epoxidase subunit PaaD
MGVAETAEHAERLAAARAVLATVPDPELPTVSLQDLGIVRELHSEADGCLHVVLTPTYSGCPATEVITHSVQAALLAAGLGPVRVSQRLSPAWTTDWISPAGKAQLLASGIVPPGPVPAPASAVVHIRPRALACPRCASLNTERLSAFGSTACKALHRCLDCREPFEHFKPL